MNELAESFFRAAEVHKDNESVRAIVSFAVEGMWPFHTGTAYLWFDYNIDYTIRTLWVELDILPTHPFHYVIDEKKMFQVHDPLSYLTYSIRDQLIKHFRYRPSLPVDDHILLGED